MWDRLSACLQQYNQHGADRLKACPTLRMKTYTISQLAKRAGLSRSTLLYYDRMGLLATYGRSPANYRLYNDESIQQLERICVLREAGLSLKDIQNILSTPPGQSAGILERRLAELGAEAVRIRRQQHQIAAMLKQIPGDRPAQVMDKEAWVQLLADSGMDEEDMRKWHIEFERSAPNMHREFLLSLGIPPAEVKSIRTGSGMHQQA